MDELIEELAEALHDLSVLGKQVPPYTSKALARAVVEHLGLEWEWFATDRTSVELEMWPERGFKTRERAECGFVYDGDDVLVRRLVSPWREVGS